MTFAALLRGVAGVLLVGLWVADYGFDALAKPVSHTVYLGLIAVVLGVDMKALREWILAALNRKQ